MKKFSFIALVILSFQFSIFSSAQAQQTYWVFLADKQGTTFDPYSYFDAKAIERYRQCGADLYDISNYPVSTAYEQGVSALATEEIGASRWMNALGVVATPEQVSAIEALSYVLRVQPIEATGMTLAEYSDPSDFNSQFSIFNSPGLSDYATVDGPLEAQLVRMGGKAFRDKGIDGRGIRIAVFDGGFPQVNTHDAFRHLRNNHQILKTWNFPNKKENVYGWNSHGTMTLSCIAGRMGDKDLGLATGAEFLLARTEVNSEPFKEEVWWQMAVEWADKNGANIISSSLGYGKERHYTRDMDGTSYVAKAGNLAARKGILVCNSAGNEADDKQWRTIITPADADSVLCIGGIENSLTEYNHISFSSYGPSADGRLKPNVCAFGYARTANTGKDDAYHYVHGTSFSCPLVAGFAACAWQASPGKTAMEMFHLIEQSADLYPYADYSFGYGVPQADYFVNNRKVSEPTFRFEKKGGDLLVRPLRPVVGKPIFYKDQRSDGQIVRYAKRDIVFLDTTGALHFTPHYTLVVHLDGYTCSYTDTGNYCVTAKAIDEYLFGEIVTADNTYVVNEPDYRTTESNLTPSKWGSNNTWRYNIFFGLGLPVKFDNAELTSDTWSPSWSFGLRVLRSFSKSYCLGASIEGHFTHYRFNDASVNALETSLGISQANIDAFKEVSSRSLVATEAVLEIFQRVRLVPGGIFGNGLHWDLGIYGSLLADAYTLGGLLPSGSTSASVSTEYALVDALSDHRWNFGVSTRLVNDWYGIYARYRLNSIGSDPAAGKVLLPRLTVGLLLNF